MRIDSKKAITTANFELMMAIPYEKITVKDICERAHISRMSFYRYYKNKEAIILAYADERFEEFYNLYIKNVENLDINSIVLELISYIKKYSRQLLVLYKSNKMNILLDSFESYTLYIENRVKENIEDINELVAPFYSGGLYNVLVYWAKHNFALKEEYIAQKLSELIR